MSGLSGSIPPRSRPAPERPPVENWTIIPGQCFRRPSMSRPNFSGSEDGVSSSFLTWRWASVAPASKAACVDSTCSATVIGTAGLSLLRGREPVIATVMTQGKGSDIEEHRLVVALEADVEAVDGGAVAPALMAAGHERG